MQGETALDKAKEQGHTAIVAAIEQQSEPLTKSAAQGGAGGADQSRQAKRRRHAAGTNQSH